MELLCTPNKKFHHEPSGPLVMVPAALPLSHLIILVRAFHIGTVSFHQAEQDIIFRSENPCRIRGVWC